jgi:hypothetical protein
MTDLNTLISADSHLFLVEALGINDRGEISGYAINTETGEAPAFSAIPCDENHPGIEGGDYSLVEGNTAATGISPARESLKSQNAPTFRGLGNPMLRRFGRGLGPWYRGAGAQPNQ